MGTTYLPVNKNWSHYTAESDRVYTELQNEVTTTLTTLANHAASKGQLIRNLQLFVDL